MKKRVLALVMIVMMLAAMFTGCAEPAASNDSPQPAAPNTDATTTDTAQTVDPDEEYVFITPLMSLEYFQQHKNAVEDAANDLGVTGYMAGTEKYDAQEMVTVFDTLIEKGVAGIITPGHFADAYRDCVERAWAKGIPVATVTLNIPDSKVLSHFGTNYVTYGEIMAKTLMDKIGKEKFIFSTNLQGGGDPAHDIMKGILNVCEANPGFEMVAQVEDQSDAAVAASVIGAALQANPDVKGVIGAQSVSGIGAVTALREAGLLDKVDIVCIDKDAPTLEAIADGDIYATVIGKQYTEVYYATKFLYDYNHNKLKLVSDSKAAGISPLPSFVDTGAIIVTKDNVSFFQ
ncbi:MAG: substrate-binding domain-containing protein [Christensenellales bacterium]|jgi:ribose transport system substrate-binding protein